MGHAVAEDHAQQLFRDEETRPTAATRSVQAAQRCTSSPPAPQPCPHLEQRSAQRGIVIGVHISGAARQLLAILLLCLRLRLLAVAVCGAGAACQLGICGIDGSCVTCCCILFSPRLLLFIAALAARVDLKSLLLHSLLLLCLPCLDVHGVRCRLLRRACCACCSRPIALDLLLELTHLAGGGGGGGGGGRGEGHRE